MKIKILAFLISATLFTCSKKMNPDKYKKSQIVFGNGGGFTNLVHQYHLLENGRLYHKQNNADVFEELGKQDSDSVKVLFDEVKVLFDSTETFREPGNVYYFVKFKQDSVTKEIVWGSSTEKPPEAVKDFYKKLMNLVTQFSKL